jgi:hypothetical protein
MKWVSWSTEMRKTRGGELKILAFSDLAFAMPFLNT